MQRSEARVFLQGSPVSSNVGPTVIAVHSGDPASALDAVRSLMRELGGVAAFARDRHLTVVASNHRARAISAAFEPGVNLARFAFIDPGPSRETADMDEILATIAGLLRDSLEQHEGDERFRDLVGELAALSIPFARLWAEDGAATRRNGHVFCGASGQTFTFRELQLIDDYEHTVVVLSRTAFERAEGPATLRTG